MVGRDSAGRNIYGRTWYGRFTDANGRRVLKSFPQAKSKREADAMLSEIKREVAERKAGGLQPRLNPELTVGELLADYLAYARDHLRQGDRLATRTRSLLRFFGEDRKAISLCKSDVEAFIKWRKDQPKERGTGTVQPATVNRELALLKTAYQRAIQDEVLEKNPVALVKMLREDNVRDRVLSPAEYEALLAACPDYLRLMVRTAYETGMRRGEIENLRWDQVDLGAGFISLKGEDTKTGEGRRVPMPSELVEEFKVLKRAQTEQDTAIEALPYVFRRPGRRGGFYVRVGSTKRSFNHAKSKAGIEDFRFHDLRHCFVTRMLDAGVPGRVVNAITGHKTDSMMRRYDSGPSETLLRDAVDQAR